MGGRWPHESFMSLPRVKDNGVGLGWRFGSGGRKSRWDNRWNPGVLVWGKTNPSGVNKDNERQSPRTPFVLGPTSVKFTVNKNQQSTVKQHSITHGQHYSTHPYHSCTSRRDVLGHNPHLPLHLFQYQRQKRRFFSTPDLWFTHTLYRKQKSSRITSFSTLCLHLLVL